MNLCDSNVWLSLSLSAHVHHRAARDWLDTTTEPQPVLFCRATQQSLLRLLTTAAVLAPYGNPPLTNRLAATATAAPKLWMDAYLAAFARSAGCTLVTTDAAFTQFHDLDLRLLAT